MYICVCIYLYIYMCVKIYIYIYTRKKILIALLDFRRGGLKPWTWTWPGDYTPSRCARPTGGCFMGYDGISCDLHELNLC